mgnify:CR=1 FL=1
MVVLTLVQLILKFVKGLRIKIWLRELCKLLIYGVIDICRMLWEHQPFQGIDSKYLSYGGRKLGQKCLCSNVHTIESQLSLDFLWLFFSLESGNKLVKPISGIKNKLDCTFLFDIYLICIVISSVGRTWKWL